MKCLIKEKLSAHKYKDNNGYLICVDSVLARTGKQTYLRSEIFADAADDNTEVEVDRKPEEVFSDKTLASFENCPICVEHPDEDVNPENYKEYAVGFVRDVHKGMDDGKEVILGTLVITDAKTIEEIENGEHTDLSCGYDCDIDDSAHPQQRNIRGNHVALCEQGRAGNARIVDTAKKVKDDKIIQQDGEWVIKKEESRFGHEYIRVYYKGREVQEFDLDDYDDENEAENEARFWVHAEKRMRGQKDSVKDDLVFGYTDLDLKKAEEMLSKAEDEKEKKLLQNLVAKIKFELKNKEYKDSVKDSERFIICHNTGAGEEVYYTDDFSDACEELKHLGKMYYIIDTKDDYKKITYGEVMRMKDSVKDSLTKEEEDLIDYAIRNLDHQNNADKLIRVMSVYYSAYAELARRKPEEVKEYFKQHINDSVKDKYVKTVWKDPESQLYIEFDGEHYYVATDDDVDRNYLFKTESEAKSYLQRYRNELIKKLIGDSKSVKNPVKDANHLVNVYNKSGKLLNSKRFNSRTEVDRYVSSLENFFDMTGKEDVYKNNRGELDIHQVWKVVVDDSVKDWNNISSNSFGHARIYGIHNEEDLLKRANESEKVYIEQDYNGKTKGTWVSAKALYKEYKEGNAKFEDSVKDVEPHAGESKEDFIARFMKETKEEYPDEKQRLAVAYSYWEKKDMKDSAEYKKIQQEIEALEEELDWAEDHNNVWKASQIQKRIDELRKKQSTYVKDDNEFKPGDKVEHVAQHVIGVVERKPIKNPGNIYVRWEPDYIIEDGLHIAAGEINPNIVKLRKINDSVKDAKIDYNDLRQFCIENKYYTRGTIAEYDRLLSNCRNWSLDEIAKDIAEHSDGVWSGVVYNNLLKKFPYAINDTVKDESYDMVQKDGLLYLKREDGKLIGPFYTMKEACEYVKIKWNDSVKDSRPVYEEDLKLNDIIWIRNSAEKENHKYQFLGHEKGNPENLLLRDLKYDKIISLRFAPDVILMKDSVKDDGLEVLSKKYDVINRDNVDEFLRDFNKLYNRHLSADGGDIVNENYKDIYNVNGAGAQVEYLVKLLKNSIRDEKIIHVTLEGKTYKAVYNGTSSRYPDMADVYIPELALYNNDKYTPADDLGNHPKDGKYYIKKDKIYMRDEETTAERVTEKLEKGFESFKESRMEDDKSYYTLLEFPSVSEATEFRNLVGGNLYHKDNSLKMICMKTSHCETERAKKIIKELNGKITGYSNGPVSDSVKDAKLTYFFRYKDLYHNEVHSEEIKANSVNEAIEELRRRVSLRGIGTANVYVNHIDIKETGEYYPFGYGKLNVLTIDSKKLIDAVKVAKLSKIIKNKK